MPTIWRKQPRPTQCFTRTNGLKRDATLSGHERLKSDIAIMDQIKMLSITPSFENALVQAESFSENVEIMGI